MAGAGEGVGRRARRRARSLRPPPPRGCPPRAPPPPPAGPPPPPPGGGVAGGGGGGWGGGGGARGGGRVLSALPTLAGHHRALHPHLHPHLDLHLCRRWLLRHPGKERPQVRPAVPTIHGHELGEGQAGRGVQGRTGGPPGRGRAGRGGKGRDQRRKRAGRGRGAPPDHGRLRRVAEGVQVGLAAGCGSDAQLGGDVLILGGGAVFTSRGRRARRRVGGRGSRQAHTPPRPRAPIRRHQLRQGHPARQEGQAGDRTGTRGGG